MIRKTIGGDRLGSGNRMKVDMHGFERSTHNRGYLWRSSMAAGTLVPFVCEVAKPGDTFDFNLDADIKTHPTIGPLFGSYKVQLDLFICPIRLYNGLLHNNPLDIGRRMVDVKLPRIAMTARPAITNPLPNDVDNCQINPSCLLAYLGIRGIGASNSVMGRNFNATAILGYWDIYKNYYANKQEEIGSVLHTPAEALVNTIDTIQVFTFQGGTLTISGPADGPDITTIQLFRGNTIQINWTLPAAQPKPEQVLIVLPSGELLNLASATGPWTLNGSGDALSAVWIAPNTVIERWQYVSQNELGIGKPSVVTFPLENLDEMRNQILINMGTTPFLINTPNLEPYRFLYENPNNIPNVLSSQEGLALKTYQSDIFQNWMNTEWIDGPGGITETTAIDTSGGSFTMDQLNISQKLYEMLNRIAISGGTVDNWQEAVYAHRGFGKTEIPMYIGGLSKELVFQEVVSTAQSENQPLATLAGKGIMGKKHKGGNVIAKINEMSYIIGLISLTPRIDYSQGNRYDVNLLTMDDFHKPPLDEIGFQDDINEKRAWWSTSLGLTGEWEQTAAGKLPAWIDYMTNYNRTYGNFAVASNEMFMTLNRRYEYEQVTFGPGVEGLQIKDLTTYIDPSKFNFIFAQTALDAQNFWVQVAVNMTVRQKMSAKIMPNL